MEQLHQPDVSIADGHEQAGLRRVRSGEEHKEQGGRIAGKGGGQLHRDQGEPDAAQIQTHIRNHGGLIDAYPTHPKGLYDFGEEGHGLNLSATEREH